MHRQLTLWAPQRSTGSQTRQLWHISQRTFHQPALPKTQIHISYLRRCVPPAAPRFQSVALLIPFYALLKDTSATIAEGCWRRFPINSRHVRNITGCNSGAGVAKRSNFLPVCGMSRHNMSVFVCLSSAANRLCTPPLPPLLLALILVYGPALLPTLSFWVGGRCFMLVRLIW